MVLGLRRCSHHGYRSEAKGVAVMAMMEVDLSWEAVVAVVMGGTATTRVGNGAATTLSRAPGTP